MLLPEYFGHHLRDRLFRHLTATDVSVRAADDVVGRRTRRRAPASILQ